MSTLTTAQRDALPESDFGAPAKRLFPIMDQSDADAAGHLIGRAKNIDTEAVKARIIAICKRKGLKPPEAWMQPADAKMSEPDYVEREGPIFEVGDYPAQGVSVTPEDLLAMEADFQPVDIELQHYDTDGKPNILSGKLGQLVGVSVAENGTTLIGRTRIPTWLHGLYEGDPIKPSVVIDKETKQLARLGLVLRPQVTTAALFSAYAQFAGARHSSGDMADMQAMHDIAIKQGAMCDPKNCPSPAQMSANQPPTSKQREKKKMGLWDEIKAAFAKATPDELATFSAADPDGAPAPPPAPTPPPAPAPDPEVAALKAQLATFAEQARKSTATQKVDALIQERRLYPGERPYALAAFTLAMEDDERDSRLVTFAAPDGKEIKANRVAVLEAQHKARPQHNLTTEQVAVFALPPMDGKDAEAEAQKRKDKLLAMTPAGQEVIKSRNGNGAH